MYKKIKEAKSVEIWIKDKKRALRLYSKDIEDADYLEEYAEDFYFRNELDLPEFYFHIKYIRPDLKVRFF